MLNCVYRLVEPFAFEPIEVDCDLDETEVLVRPTHLSICNADQRYYQGKRSSAALAKKLPMALIHEAIGKVVYCADGTFEHGQRVVMIPNQAFETSEVRAENYLPSSHFCGSGFDGFMQEFISLPKSRVLALPEDVPNEIASFTELLSVAVHTQSRFDKTAHEDRGSFGIWGDGNLGFLIALTTRIKYPKSKIYICGRKASKLADFTFADATFMSYEANKMPSVDHAFECCGGEGATSAIAQIISHIKPEGTVCLLGVSENPVPIESRMVLEKGLRIVGSSRSTKDDFIETLDLYKSHPRLKGYLGSLVNNTLKVTNTHDISSAFNADINKTGGKTVMEWRV